MLKTCAKICIRFRDHPGDHLDVPGGPDLAPLPQLINQSVSA